MIYPYNHDRLREWNRGDLQVQINVPGRRLPMGYCDGSDEDEQELHGIAESEGMDGELPIHKKLLKTGRQIWTVGNEPEYEDQDFDE